MTGFWRPEAGENPRCVSPHGRRGLQATTRDLPSLHEMSQGPNRTVVGGMIRDIQHEMTTTEWIYSYRRLLATFVPSRVCSDCRGLRCSSSSVPYEHTRGDAPCAPRVQCHQKRGRRGSRTGRFAIKYCMVLGTKRTITSSVWYCTHPWAPAPDHRP